MKIELKFTEALDLINILSEAYYNSTDPEDKKQIMCLLGKIGKQIDKINGGNKNDNNS